MILADKNKTAPKTVSLKKKEKKTPRCHKSIYIYIKNYMLYHGFSQDSVWQSLNGFLYLLMSFFYLYTVHSASRQFQLWLLINIMWSRSVLSCIILKIGASVYSGGLIIIWMLYFNLIFHYFYSISAQCSLVTRNNRSCVS